MPGTMKNLRVVVTLPINVAVDISGKVPPTLCANAPIVRSFHYTISLYYISKFVCTMPLT